MTLEFLERAFDPSEPRDERGRWEGDGGDSGDGGGKGDGHPGKGYSASAYVKDGVIHTNSVYDAQRALFENRKVELDQPRTVSVLIHKLGEVSKKMIEQGKAAPVFNLCNVSIKGTNLFCADSKGIPRVEMPQLDKQQTRDFQKYLKDQGYKVKKDKEYASHLRATQNELNGAKVAAGAEKIIENGGKVKPIIISKDDYVLDGHHAWAAKLGLDAASNDLEDNTKMHVVRVNIKITKLLEEADKFTGGKGRKGVDEPNKSYVSFGEVFRDWEDPEAEPLAELIERGFSLEDTRRVYVRSRLMEAHRAISMMEAEGFVLIPYDGEHIPGTDLIDLAEWEERVLRADPKTLYVNRPLLNADEVIDWAKSQGFEKTITPDDMHVTVAFSRAPVDWDLLDQDRDPLTITGGRRSVDRLGADAEAVVLRFESAELQKCWQKFVDAGASWDYDDYKPHVTISFDAPDIDVADIEPFTGKLLFGPEVFAVLNDDWKTTITERTVDYIQDPVTGHLMGSHGSGDSDKDSGDKEPAKPEPSPEVMAVGGDEWNKQTAERLEKEYVEAEPALEKIISDAVAAETKVEDPEDVQEPNPEDAPFVPDEWGSMTDQQQTEVFDQWKSYTESSYMDSEIESWAENNKLDDAASELAWKFEKGESQEWAVDGIDEARTVLEDQKIPFTNAQLLEAMTVKFDGGWGNIEKGLDISFDDSKLKPIGWDDAPTLPGVEPKKPEDALTKEMRDTLIAEMTTTFEKAAEDLDIEPPEYLKESVEEYQDQHWSDMSDKEKFAWAESHSDTMKYLQEEYDKFYGKGDKPVEANAPFVMPKKLDPLQEEGGKNYAGTQKVARLLSVERAAQLMVARGLYPDDHLGKEPVDFVNAQEWEKWSNDQKLQLARTDAKRMDNSLWTGWKGSSSSYEGQTLQKATAEELGGRLNPMMVSDHAQITKVAEMLATNAAPGKAWDAVKAYVRGKWETSQYLLKKAGLDTVNVYRSVDIPDAAKPVVTDNTDRPNGMASVKTVKIFDTENEAELHREHQAAEYGNDYTSNISNVHNVYQLNSTHNFSDLDKANAFAKKYETDPDNPEQHKEEVSTPSEDLGGGYSSSKSYTRLPDIQIDRNGAASTTTTSTVANSWDGHPGRVVLRASVPRTAVVSVPAYGINIVGEHEVVVAGTAWKSWSAWKGTAPMFEQIPEVTGTGIAA